MHSGELQHWFLFLPSREGCWVIINWYNFLFGMIEIWNMAPDDLSSVLGISMVKGEKLLLQVVLWPSHVHFGIPLPPPPHHTRHTNNWNVILKVQIKINLPCNLISLTNVSSAGVTLEVPECTIPLIEVYFLSFYLYVGYRNSAQAASFLFTHRPTSLAPYIIMYIFFGLRRYHRKGRN